VNAKSEISQFASVAATLAGWDTGPFVQSISLIIAKNEISSDWPGN